jgi:hypothetical protein
MRENKQSQEFRDKVSRATKGKNKGKVRSQEFRKNASETLKGKPKSEETRQRMSEAAKQRSADYYEKTIHSADARAKVADALRGVAQPWHAGIPLPESTRKAMSQTKKGKPKTIEHRQKMAETRRGEKSHWWKGGVHEQNYSSRQAAIRKLPYKIWREAVFTRANHTCELKDETCSGPLQAHHIKGWTEFPEFRYDVSNGQALCQSHHRRTDNFAGRALALTKAA